MRKLRRRGEKPPAGADAEPQIRMNQGVISLLRCVAFVRSSKDPSKALSKRIPDGPLGGCLMVQRRTIRPACIDRSHALVSQGVAAGGIACWLLDGYLIRQASGRPGRGRKPVSNSDLGHAMVLDGYLIRPGYGHPVDKKIVCKQALVALLGACPMPLSSKGFSKDRIRRRAP